MPINQYLVLGVTPTHNEQQVAINSVITISFAKHMDVTTLTPANIILRKVNGDIVSYTQRYISDTYQLVLTPSELLPNTQYQLQVTGTSLGVKSITGDYLSASRTYEFTTVQLKAVSEPRNLILTQKGEFIKASWTLPVDTNENEAIFYSVRVSESSNPDNPAIWPSSTEGTTTNLEIDIPKAMTLGENYYVMVQAKAGDFTSAWTIGQIFMEKPVTSEEPTPPTTDPNPNPLLQLEVVDTYPTAGGIIQDNTIMVVFNDEIADLELASVYVVQAPYKSSLTLVDKITSYGPGKAISGTVSVLPEYPNVIQFVSAEELEKEKEYCIIVEKTVAGKNVGAIGYTYIQGFRTPWERLYGSIKTIKEKLGDFASLVSDNHILESMRMNTLYAFNIASETTNYTASEYTDTEAPYYIHQYVNLQTAYDVLLNGMMNSSSGGSEESILLGVLQVDKKTDAESATGLLDSFKAEIKQWLDLVHGFRNRGYAKAQTVVRGESGDAYPDFFTREFKSDFDA